MFRAFFVILIAIASSSLATSFHGDGATPFAIKSLGVQLEKEDVKISRTATSSDTNPRWQTVSKALLYNPAAKPVEVSMEIPNWKSFDSQAEEGTWAIRRLTVETSISHGPVKHEEFNLGKNQRPYRLPGNETLFYDGGFRWTVAIPARTRVELTSSYEIGGFDSERGVDNLLNPNSPFSLMQVPVFWKKEGDVKTEAAWDFNSSHYRTLAYLASTGTTWSGRVKSTDISIELPKNVLPHLLVPQPRGYVIRDGFAHWHFENWKPRRDIYVVQLFPQKPVAVKSSCPFFNSVEQAKAWVKFSRSSRYDRFSLEAVKNTAYAKQGFVFPDAKWQAYFEAFEWYRADKTFQLDKLPANDLAIVKVLEDAERHLAE